MTLRKLLTPLLAALFACAAASSPVFAAQQTIGVGTSANDGTGDTVRAAFGKVNSNFTELYGAIPHIGMISGNWYTYGHYTTAVNGPLNNDTAIACPIYVPNAVTISKVGLTMNTAVAGANVKMALYGTTSSRPGTRLGLSGVCPAATAGADVNCALTAPVAVTPGWYWIAEVFSASVNLLNVAGDQIFMSQMGATTIAALVGNTAQPACQINNATTYAGGLSNPFGGADRMNNSYTPLMAILIQ